MSDEPFITLPSAKPKPKETPFLVVLMSLTGIVVGIAFLALWMMQPFSPGCVISRSSRTTAQVQLTFTTPLKLFRIHVGRYPHRLDELLNPCPDCPDSARWRGPYIKNTTPLKDDWGQDLAYQSPGLHNKSSYDLSSPGLDGIAATPDDITNW